MFLIHNQFLITVSRTLADIKRIHDSKYLLKLYVTGSTSNSVTAIRNLKQILQELGGAYKLQIIDILKNPKLAEDEKILATPALDRKLPPPIKRIIGDLSDKEHVLIGLDLVTKGGNYEK